MIYQFQTWLRI